MSFISTVNLFSQIQYSSPNSLSSNIIQNLSGPRVGLTLLTNGDLKKTLSDEFGLNSNVNYLSLVTNLKNKLWVMKSRRIS